MEYAVCQIAGKQVVVEPGKEIIVPFLGDVTNFESDEQSSTSRKFEVKVILICEKGKVSLGTPFLKDKLKFVVTGEASQKTRVAFYKLKANHRKATGQKTLSSKIKLVV